ncbi:hypothetical protein F4808DRAFT_456588 [Astrocystis sublimbata]|nr:hypothetical protein F4808DRAFT_456588 [Astrocystis sublimbata]
MPASNVNDYLAAKPLTFKIKTSGGSWKCQLHSNRAAYEKTRPESTSEPAPGIERTDSGLSTTSTSSADSTSSH